MRLLNYTSAYFAAALFVIISVWATLFYYTMLDEIYDSIDDGLDNQKGLVIQKAAYDTTVLNKHDFEESDYAITEISAPEAVNSRDTYIDTMMYMQNEKSDEPVRLLRTVFLQQGRYYRLQVATSMVEEDDLIKQLFYSILWLYIGLVVTIILFNNFLLKKIWHPFYHIMKQLKKFRLDKPQPIATAPTKVDEFRLLNETIERLLKRNMDIYANQKNFIENAAHELQTPLAVSINKLEALADSNPLSESQVSLLASAQDNLERLNRLNKSLLLLSKIENKQFAENKNVNINGLVKKVAADFADQAAFSNVTISITENGSCVQTMNEDLAAVLISNLVKNALLHNSPSGSVHLVINKNSLSVENSGAAALDPEKIFNRFNSGQPSPASTGLGLAIAKAISDLYGFRITYSFNQGHIFLIQF